MFNNWLCLSSFSSAKRSFIVFVFSGNQKKTVGAIVHQSGYDHNQKTALQHRRTDKKLFAAKKVGKLVSSDDQKFFYVYDQMSFIFDSYSLTGITVLLIFVFRRQNIQSFIIQRCTFSFSIIKGVQNQEIIFSFTTLPISKAKSSKNIEKDRPLNIIILRNYAL